MKIDLRVAEKFQDVILDWDYKNYLLIGGYGSSKSYSAVIKIILKLLKEKRTCLVVRDVFATLRESTFSLIKEVIYNMGLSSVITINISPMRIIFPNGSEIVFKGLDDPAKLRSLNNVSICFIEEIGEISYSAYKELLGRVRHETLSLHFIMCTNPVPKTSFVYTHFFRDDKNGIFILDDEQLYKKGQMIIGDTFYHHSTVDDNPFLPSGYKKALDEMKVYDPGLYRIARLGQFGSTGVIVLPQFEIQPHKDILKVIENIPSQHLRVGMDFGFVESYNAVVRLAIDDKEKILYIYWEYYSRGLTDDKLVMELEEFKHTQEVIYADSAEPKTIEYFKQEGYKMLKAKKGVGSRLQNTKKMKRFKKIICSSECENVIKEWKDLSFKEDRNGNLIEDEFNRDPHTFEAAWYALSNYNVSDLKDRSNYSGTGKR